MVGAGGKRAALAGLKVHHIVADRPPAEHQCGLPRLAQQGKVNAEAAIGCLRAGDRLEDEINRRSGLHCPERRRHVGEDAGLGGDGVAGDQLIQHAHQRHRLADAVGGGIDADHRIAATVEQAVEHRGGDAGGIIGGVVGLQAHGQPAGQADGIAEGGDDADATGNGDQILIAHQFRNRGDHLRHQARCQRRQRLCRRRIRQQPVAQTADGQAGNRAEGGGVMAIDDQPRHLVVLVRHQRLGEECRERQFGESEAGGDPLRIARSRHAGQHITRPQGGGAGQQRLQIGEDMAATGDGGGVGHRFSRSPLPASATGSCVDVAARQHPFHRRHAGKQLVVVRRRAQVAGQGVVDEGKDEHGNENEPDHLVEIEHHRERDHR